MADKSPKKKVKKPVHQFNETVTVGNTVRMVENRVGLVRYKGKVKFARGIWYGVEVYHLLLKTRHNGTVLRNRYFNCPRNKGLFVRREQITDIIGVKDVKKVLKELEKEQTAQQKEERKLRIKLEKAAVKKKNKKKKNDEKTSALAVYQNQVYGNKKLLLSVNQEENVEHERKNTFARYARMSLMINAAEMQEMLKDDKSSHIDDDDDDDDDDDNDGDDKKKDGGNGGGKENVKKNANKNEKYKKISIQKNNPLNLVVSKLSITGGANTPTYDDETIYDVNSTAFGESLDKPPFETVRSDEVSAKNEHLIRLFYEIEEYFVYSSDDNGKGCVICEMNVSSKNGREFLMEFGIQANQGWCIQAVNYQDIRMLSAKKVKTLFDEADLEEGYIILLKKKYINKKK